MGTYRSLEVASFIALTCNELGFSWNNTKIQKLLYCCYGSVLAAYDERLCDEYPRAWQYGPVFPKVFKYINKKKPFPLASRLDIPAEKRDFLVSVIKAFGPFNAVPLSEWTHKEGSPWYTVVHELHEPNNFIPDDLIKSYFAEHVVRDSTNGEKDN